MKRLNFLVALSLITILGISVISYGASISACRSSCNTTSACAGPRGDEDGQPVGCTSSCSGSCQVCRNGTSSDFCQYTGDAGDTCISNNTSWTDCGDEYEADCQGSSAPCTCSGDESYVDNDCKIHFCST